MGLGFLSQAAGRSVRRRWNITMGVANKACFNERLSVPCDPKTRADYIFYNCYPLVRVGYSPEVTSRMTGRDFDLLATSWKPTARKVSMRPVHTKASGRFLCTSCGYPSMICAPRSAA